MRRPWLKLGVIAIALLVLAGGFAGYQLVQRVERPGPLAAETTIVIPRGAGLDAIAGQLAEAGIIERAWLFGLVVRLEGRGRGLRAGEYLMPAAISMRETIALLEAGRTVVRRVTFPEGLTSQQLVALLNDTEGLEGSVEAVPPEGSLLPETYHFSLRDSRQALVTRMAEARDAVIAELWPERSEGLPIASPEEAVILASIVEKETGVPEERPLVAGVFLNRLRKGMRLQSDPTVIYGLTNGSGALGRELTRKDLAKANPYNTYTVDGLPPGPIANPGRASLEAVLQPAATEYLYFVADGSGGHVFAKTLDQHNRNVANWRKIKRQKKRVN